MPGKASSTLPREAKGPIAPAPLLEGSIEAVRQAIATWPGVEVTSHWHLRDRARVDGVDFYVGGEELGHIHLDGSIHLATSAELGAALVESGLGRPFAWAHGWTLANVDELGVAGAVDLFRRNFDRLVLAADD